MSAYANAAVTSDDDGTSQKMTHVTTTKTTVNGDDDKALNMRLIVIPCVLATIPAIVIIVCLVRATVRHLFSRKPSTSTSIDDPAADLPTAAHGRNDSTDKKASVVDSPGNCLYVTPMYHEKFNSDNHKRGEV